MAKNNKKRAHIKTNDAAASGVITHFFSHMSESQRNVCNCVSNAMAELYGAGFLCVSIAILKIQVMDMFGYTPTMYFLLCITDGI